MLIPVNLSVTQCQRQMPVMAISFIFQPIIAKSMKFNLVYKQTVAMSVISELHGYKVQHCLKMKVLLSKRLVVVPPLTSAKQSAWKIHNV